MPCIGWVSLRDAADGSNVDRRYAAGPEIAREAKMEPSISTESATLGVDLLVPPAIGEVRVAHLIQKGIPEDIASIDLEMVKMKMSEPKEGVGWNAEQVEAAEIEYKRYLTLCRKFPAPQHSIVPNKIMDTMWHYHILDTRAYCADSDRVFGGYFHHFPYFGLRGDDDAKALVSSFEVTKQLYEETFGEPMVRDEATDCWHDCEGRCWHACSN